MKFGYAKDYVPPSRCWFAWRPVILTDGRIAWLETVWCFWGQVKYLDMVGIAHFGGGWKYEALKQKSPR